MLGRQKLVIQRIPLLRKSKNWRFSHNVVIVELGFSEPFFSFIITHQTTLFGDNYFDWLTDT
jgi:hypothetical protein